MFTVNTKTQSLFRELEIFQRKRLLVNSVVRTKHYHVRVFITKHTHLHVLNIIENNTRNNI